MPHSVLTTVSPRRFLCSDCYSFKRVLFCTPGIGTPGWEAFVFPNISTQGQPWGAMLLARQLWQVCGLARPTAPEARPIQVLTTPPFSVGGDGQGAWGVGCRVGGDLPGGLSLLVTGEEGWSALLLPTCSFLGSQG